MVSLINTLGASKAIELPECRRNKMWYEFRQLVEFLNINTTKDKLDMESHISAIEKYFSGSPHFSLGRQGDATELFLVSSNFFDKNDEEFSSNATYNIAVRQSICCLVCGQRSTQMVDKNRCLYLSIDDRASGMKNTVYDLMNA